MCFAAPFIVHAFSNLVASIASEHRTATRDTTKQTSMVKKLVFQEPAVHEACSLRRAPVHYATLESTGTPTRSFSST